MISRGISLIVSRLTENHYINARKTRISNPSEGFVPSLEMQSCCCANWRRPNSPAPHRAVLQGPAMIWGAAICPCIAGAAPRPLMGRQVAWSKHILSSSKHQLDLWSNLSHLPTAWSQDFGFATCHS